MPYVIITNCWRMLGPFDLFGNVDGSPMFFGTTFREGLHISLSAPVLFLKCRVPVTGPKVTWWYQAIVQLPSGMQPPL